MSSTPERSAPPVALGARRLASFATNLLVSGVILVVGLTAGREVLWWWRTPADDAGNRAELAANEDAPTWQFETGVFDLRFGDAPLVVRRHPLTGTRAQASDALRRHAVELARKALDRPPRSADATRAMTSANVVDVGAATSDVSAESDRAHGASVVMTERLARQLDATPPVAGEPGRWALYEWDDPWPLNVVVRPESREPLAWGLAMPGPLDQGAERSWSLFVWTADDEADDGAAIKSSRGDSKSDDRRTAESGLEVARVEFPRPPGSRQGLSVQARDGSGLAQFEARGKNLAWCEAYYEDWARRSGARLARPWRGERGLRSAGYQADDGAQWQVDLDGRSADSVQGLVTRWISDQTKRE